MLEEKLGIGQFRMGGGLQFGPPKMGRHGSGYRSDRERRWVGLDPLAL